MSLNLPSYFLRIVFFVLKMKNVLIRQQAIIETSSCVTITASRLSVCVEPMVSPQGLSTVKAFLGEGTGGELYTRVVIKSHNP